MQAQQEPASATAPVAAAIPSSKTADQTMLHVLLGFHQSDARRDDRRPQTAGTLARRPGGKRKSASGDAP